MCPPYMLFTRLFRITFKEHNFRSTVYKYEGLIFTVTMARENSNDLNRNTAELKALKIQITAYSINSVILLLLLLVYVEKMSIG